MSWNPWIVVLPLALSLSLLAICPYTKVEESFNLQATHDFLRHGTDLDAFDHHAFPGVVPRTFVGALALALASSPAVAAARSAEAAHVTEQLVVRGVLASAVYLAMARFGGAVRSRLGRGDRRYDAFAVAFAAVQLCQFHLPFYASRTLPNTFALVPVLIGWSLWLEGAAYAAIAAFGFAGIVFRADIAVLCVPIGVAMLVRREVTLPRALLCAVAVAAGCLAATVPIDSLLWRRPLWPEGEVLWYNTVENKSANWGTMPPLWYFTSALPRSMLGALPVLGGTLVLALLGIGGARDALRPLAPHIAAALAFVALYSFLPHKELRFIFPALPVLNAAAAAVLARLWDAVSASTTPSGGEQRNAGATEETQAATQAATRKKQKSATAVRRKSVGCTPLTRFALLAAVGVTLAGVPAASVFAEASRRNYPGATALAWLHDSVAAPPSEEAPLHVHIDAAAATRGVTRFVQARDATGWRYSKDETLCAGAGGKGGGAPCDDENNFATFDFLVTEAPERHTSGCFKVVHTAKEFARLQLNLAALKRGELPITFVERDAIHVMMRHNYDMRCLIRPALRTTLSEQLGILIDEMPLV